VTAAAGILEQSPSRRNRFRLDSADARLGRLKHFDLSNEISHGPDALYEAGDGLGAAVCLSAERKPVRRFA
jgi:hypothetical protein